MNASGAVPALQIICLPSEANKWWAAGHIESREESCPPYHAFGFAGAAHYLGRERICLFCFPAGSLPRRRATLHRILLNAALDCFIVLAPKLVIAKVAANSEMRRQPS
jgi:hypothetical protein